MFISSDVILTWRVLKWRVFYVTLFKFRSFNYFYMLPSQPQNPQPMNLNSEQQERLNNIKSFPALYQSLLEMSRGNIQKENIKSVKKNVANLEKYPSSVNRHHIFSKNQRLFNIITHLSPEKLPPNNPKLTQEEFLSKIKGKILSSKINIQW